MLSMLLGFVNDINFWIQGWDDITFALVTIVLVLFLALSTTAFIKKAVSDKPAIKIGKIIVIALFLFMIVYVISVH